MAKAESGLENFILSTWQDLKGSQRQVRLYKFIPPYPVNFLYGQFELYGKL